MPALDFIPSDVPAPSDVSTSSNYSGPSDFSNYGATGYFPGSNFDLSSSGTNALTSIPGAGPNAVADATVKGINVGAGPSAQVLPSGYSGQGLNPNSVGPYNGEGISPGINVKGYSGEGINPSLGNTQGIPNVQNNISPAAPTPAYQMNPITGLPMTADQIAGSGSTATGGNGIMGGGQEPPSALQKGMNTASDWIGDNKGLAMGLGLLGLAAIGHNKSGSFNTSYQPSNMNTGYYKLNPATFQPTRQQPTTNPVKPVYANYQQNPYQPQGYAEGGIASYKGGGSTYKDDMDELATYQSMMSPHKVADTTVPSYVGNPGIYSDSDTDTKYQDALAAAKTRFGKINKMAAMPSGPQYAVPSSQLGSINVDPAAVIAAQQAAQEPVRAAGGGIMGASPTPGMMQTGPAQVDFMGGDMYPTSQQNRSYYATPLQMPTSAQQAMAAYEPKTNPLTGELTTNMASGGITSLGGYAAGGNPRLLSGPGDGMSDNIPATIGGRQPARLADGEFVVPADVVSHLGNGSTEAGAKKLHGMMDNVRKKRTGKKSQAPAIKPDKFMPQ